MSPQAASYVDEDFERDTDYISDRITRDERDGWPVEPGRYRLVAAKACPWATRSIIVRSLLGLEDVISMGLAASRPRRPVVDLRPRRGWARTRCSASTSCATPTNAAFASYDKGITVPAMVDMPHRRVVTNDFPMITHDLFFEWSDHHRDDAPDLWPEAVRDEMDEVMERVYDEVNDGVYQCGFAGHAALVRRGVRRLFARPRLARGAPHHAPLPDGRLRSPRPTSGCSPRWPASTRSTTATSSATATS